MMISEQLWVRASKDFCLPGFPSRSGSPRWKAAGLRAIYWPSGDICWQVNMYLISCRRQGLAVSTINTYASEISSFIRFLSTTKIAVFDVADDDLIDFADWLLTTRKVSRNHVNRLILRAIAFFQWAQGPILGEQIIGCVGEGFQISLTQKNARTPNGMIRSTIHHAAMIAPSVPRVVHPMSSTILSRLMGAIDKSGKASFVRKRNRMMITVLADAGVRREELTLITKASVLDAVTSGRLKVNTSKRKGNPVREIPIPEVTILALKEFITISRAIHIRRILKKNPAFKDEGWAFCTWSGGRMAPASVTQLFSDLRSKAGVSEAATVHMLRHRFITLQLITRLRSFGKNSTIGVELLTTILSKLASISGHSSIQSLWHYMDWAYDELEHEVSYDLEENNHARQVIRDLLKEAVDESDDQLVEDLRCVFEALSTLDPKRTGFQSVLSHSLRGKASR